MDGVYKIMNNVKDFNLEEIIPPLRKINSKIIPFLLWSGLLAWIIRVTVFIRGRRDFSTVDAYAGVQVAIVIGLFLILVINQRCFEIIGKIFTKSVVVLFLYYLFCALSFSWSVLPFYSLYLSVEYLVLMVATLTALSFSANFLKAERLLLFISVIVVLLDIYKSLTLARYQTSLHALHTVSYTASAGMIFVYCFGESFKAKGKRKNNLRCYMLIGLLGLALGTSSGSILAVMGGSCLIFLLRNNYILVSILASAAIAMSILDIDLSFIKHLIFYGKSEYAIKTGSSRLILWENYMRVFLDHPLLGQGFAVLSTAKGRVISAQPHNSLFSAALSTGFLGISIVFAFLIKLFSESLPLAVKKKYPGTVGSAAALATGFANSLTNPFLFDRWEESSLVFSCLLSFFILFVLLPHRVQRNVNTSAILNKMKKS